MYPRFVLFYFENELSMEEGFHLSSGNKFMLRANMIPQPFPKCGDKELARHRGHNSDMRMVSSSSLPAHRRSSAGHAVKFRKFHVNQMENVSILFADIVGFTNMSSNKTASQLLLLLNDLFGRFDVHYQMSSRSSLKLCGTDSICQLTEEQGRESELKGIKRFTLNNEVVNVNVNTRSQEHTFQLIYTKITCFGIRIIQVIYNALCQVYRLFEFAYQFALSATHYPLPPNAHIDAILITRFDNLCEMIQCEKIATLGDCYYCVSGCPNAVPDHAERIVEMGRSMCVAIQQFDEDHTEQVNMRVGVHTGKVICGLVGTRRFKFDVWSNDVTLANQMESSGKAGKVHISETTLEFVKDVYEVSEGEPVPDIRKVKVLIEYYNKEDQRYAIKHTQDQARKLTVFDEKEGESWIMNHTKYSIPRISEHQPQLEGMRKRGIMCVVEILVIKTYFIERRFDEKPIIMLDRTDVFIPFFTNVSYILVIRSSPLPDAYRFDFYGYSGSCLRQECPPSPSKNPAALIDTNNAPSFVKDQPKTSVDQIIASPTGSNEVTLTTAPTTAETAEVKTRGSDVEMLDALWNLSKPEEVFKFPPISRFSLCFLSHSLEHIYRHQVLCIPRRSMLITLATPRLTPVTNGITHFFFFVLVIVACFINFPNLTESQLIPTIPYVVFAIALILNILFIGFIIADLCAWGGGCPGAERALQKIFWGMFNWYVRNTMGVLVICTPAVFVLANFQACLFWSSRSMDIATVADFSTGEYRMVFGLLFTFMLFNLTLFPNFSSWTKSISAMILCIIGCLLVHWPFIGTSYYCPDQVAGFATVTTARDLGTSPVWLAAAESSLFPWEITVILTLNLILIFFLNRDIDISFRVSFNRDYEASQAKKAITREKVQGELLLEDIIPRFVLTDLRKTNKYSQHVDDAAVMFASIANFSEFYDEQYQGGQEMLRVLNEIFADFEYLLSSVRFKDVEKIKTIGECFMAASGLNLVQRAQNKSRDDHLCALMDLAIELLKILDEFNQQMFNFQFELKIGYNIGEVTAGVIGTTKLLYDIWGDTVNVASRMYSTGQKGRVQVTEEVAHRLSQHYDFEYRGNVFVKGKEVQLAADMYNKPLAESSRINCPKTQPGYVLSSENTEGIV
ncbi:hypothetical protein ACTXT7_006896 [Hymenolepis weldensis]